MAAPVSTSSTELVLPDLIQESEVAFQGDKADFRKKPPAPNTTIARDGSAAVVAQLFHPHSLWLLLKLFFQLKDGLLVRSKTERKVSRLELSDFNTELTKRPSTVSLEKFYKSADWRCGECGLRLRGGKKKNQIRLHIDAHIIKKEMIKERNKKMASRGWAASLEEWAQDVNASRELLKLKNSFAKTSDTFALPPAAIPLPEEPTSSAYTYMEGLLEQCTGEVPYDEYKSVCPVCGEKFGTRWSTAYQDWVFTGAVGVDLLTDLPVIVDPPTASFTDNNGESDEALEATAKGSLGFNLPCEVFVFHVVCFELSAEGRKVRLNSLGLVKKRLLNCNVGEGVVQKKMYTPN
eukprot:Platyproteum_vivax@DN2639_c0_g1_i1.p1